MNRSRLDESREQPQRTSLDDVIDLYKKDVDRTLLIESLRMSTEERLERLAALTRFTEELREAARRPAR